MSEIKIISDSGNYHAFLGKTSVWLNAMELNQLKQAIDSVNNSGFKEGDFLRFEGDWDLVTIFAAYTSDGSWHEHASISLGSMELQTGLHITANDCEGYVVRLANEEEKNILLQALKESGYKWNEETKQVESNIAHNDKEIGKYYYFECENELAYIAKLNDVTDGGTLVFGENIVWNPIHKDVESGVYSNTTMIFKEKGCSGMRLATRAEIRVLQREREESRADRFKMFDKVLVRNYDDECWFPALFIKMAGKNKELYHCLLLDTGGSTTFNFCEPYEGNESAVYEDKQIPF